MCLLFCLFLFFVVDIILILYVCICLFYLFVIGKKVKYMQCFDSLCLKLIHTVAQLSCPLLATSLKQHPGFVLLFRKQ